MATKKKQGFDADRFLDRYEENTSQTSRASASETSQPKEERDVPEKVKDTTPDRELDYMERFILNRRYSRISRKGKQVPVSEEFKVKIQKLMLFFSDGGSITEYVNNVLEQHFAEYDDIITRMFNNSLKL